MDENQMTCNPEEIILPKALMSELLAAVNVCFEGKAEQRNNAIVYTAPNGQQFRINVENIS